MLGGGGDTTEPNTTITSGPANGPTIADDRPTFRFAANEPATFQCSIDGGPFAACASPKQIGPLEQLGDPRAALVPGREQPIEPALELGAIEIGLQEDHLLDIARRTSLPPAAEANIKCLRFDITASDRVG